MERDSRHRRLPAALLVGGFFVAIILQSSAGQSLPIRVHVAFLVRLLEREKLERQ